MAKDKEFGNQENECCDLVRNVIDREVEKDVSRASWQLRDLDRNTRDSFIFSNVPDQRRGARRAS
jgi:hypothetical protein